MNQLSELIQAAHKRTIDQLEIEIEQDEQLSLIDSFDGYLELSDKQIERVKEAYWFEDDEVIHKAYFQHGQLYIIIENVHTEDLTTFEPSMTDEEDKIKLGYILYGGIEEWNQ